MSILLAAALSMPTCLKVRNSFRYQEEAVEHKQFIVSKEIDNGLLLTWTDGATTDMLLFSVSPDLKSKLFLNLGKCSTAKGFVATFYIASYTASPT